MLIEVLKVQRENGSSLLIGKKGQIIEVVSLNDIKPSRGRI